MPKCSYGKTNTTTIIGHVNTQNLNIGKLIGNQKLLGEISADAKINATINGSIIKSEIETEVKSLTLNNYTYQNIKINGKVDDKLFDGHLIIDDPNLKQEFDGKID